MATTIGTQERPLKDKAPATLARALIQDQMMTPRGLVGVLFIGGRFWAWEGGRWALKKREEMKRFVMRWAENVCVDELVAGEWVAVPLGPTEATVDGVVFAMESICELRIKQYPCWLQEPGVEGMDPDYTVAFEDRVVCVKGGVLREVGRDERYFDPVVLPVRWEERGTPCPRWERAVGQEWGDGDGAWGELLRRMMGATLVAGRKWRKWGLLEGKTTGGKGVIFRVMKKLLGGVGYTSVQMNRVKNQFGLADVQFARMLAVPEVVKLDGAGQESFAGLVKNVVGADGITVEEKWEPVQRDVGCRAMVWMSSNQIPMLPNQGQGLSAKMLVLPFVKSYSGRQDDDLERVLEEVELAGIAAWAVEGARRLEEVAQGERWPVPKEAADVELQYRLLNNPLDAFLETHFVQQEGGWVSGDLVRARWGRFVKENKVRLGVPNNQLLVRLEREGSWGVRRARARSTNGNTGERGLRGLAVKKVQETDF